MPSFTRMAAGHWAGQQPPAARPGQTRTHTACLGIPGGSRRTLPQVAVEPIRALVFDANVFGKSVEPNVQTIERWAAACRNNGAELWIPDVVAWELAQRVVAASAEFEQALRQHNARREKWGSAPVPVPEGLTVDVDSVVSALEDAGATIVELSAEAAQAALRDQVLQLGSGSTKRGVKTGAADSGWIRSVLEENGGEAAGLIFVSGDQAAIFAVCEDLGAGSPRIAKHLGEIGELLGGTTPASEEQVNGFLACLESLVSDRDAAYDLAELADVSRHNWWPRELPREFEIEWDEQESFVEPRSARAEIVGVVVYDPWSRTIAARVRLDMHVEEQFARQNSWGDAPEYVSVQYDAWAEGDLTVFVGPDGGLIPAERFDDVELGVDAKSLQFLEI